MIDHVWIFLQVIAVAVVASVVTTITTNWIKTRLESGPKQKAQSEENLRRLHILGSKLLSLVMDLKKACDDAFWAQGPQAREEALERMVQIYQDDAVSGFRYHALEQDARRPHIVEVARQITLEFEKCNRQLADLPDRLGTTIHIKEWDSPDKPRPPVWYVDMVDRPFYRLAQSIEEMIRDVESAR